MRVEELGDAADCLKERETKQWALKDYIPLIIVIEEIGTDRRC